MHLFLHSAHYVLSHPLLVLLSQQDILKSRRGHLLRMLLISKLPMNFNQLPKLNGRSMVDVNLELSFKGLVSRNLQQSTRISRSLLRLFQVALCLLSLVIVWIYGVCQSCCDLLLQGWIDVILGHLVLLWFFKIVLFNFDLPNFNAKFHSFDIVIRGCK